MLNIDSSTFYDNLTKLLYDRVGSEERMGAIEALGLLNEDPVKKCDTPIDSLSHFLSNKMKFGKLVES